MSAESQNTMTDMTVEEYLYGCVGFDVAENAIATILIDRGVESGSSVLALDKKTKDLCKADLYMWCASTPSIMGSVEDSNGVWKHKEGGTQSSASDKRNLRAMANDIYKLYGENTVSSSMKIVSFGMSMAKHCKR
jgi:hypothetical protein